ncbi:hypothetical protein Trydic_g21840, partial [Trypoxylus dichotomus]
EEEEISQPEEEEDEGQVIESEEDEIVEPEEDIGEDEVPAESEEIEEISTTSAPEEEISTEDENSTSDPVTTVPNVENGPLGECLILNGEYVEYLTDLKDCSIFYKCNWGVPVQMQCPNNLHFNPVLNVCDWPASAGCKIILELHSTVVISSGTSLGGFRNGKRSGQRTATTAAENQFTMVSIRSFSLPQYTQQSSPFPDSRK